MLPSKFVSKSEPKINEDLHFNFFANWFILLMSIKGYVLALIFYVGFE